MFHNEVRTKSLDVLSDIKDAVIKVSLDYIFLEMDALGARVDQRLIAA